MSTIILDWIPVTERIPESNQSVLCYNGKRMIENSWCKHTDQDDEWFKRQFTHWAICPNKPTHKLFEPFIGTLDQIREHFNRKWCRRYQIDENKWKHVAPSSIDGLVIKNTKTNLILSFWAGSSGTRNMVVDGMGGCYDLSWYGDDIFEVIG